MLQNEPPHDKTTKRHVRPAKPQISPGIRPIRVFAVRMKKALVLSYPMSAQRRLWSDWVDAQADLSLSRWAHRSFCWFCHEAAQMYLLPNYLDDRVKKHNRVNRCLEFPGFPVVILIWADPFWSLPQVGCIRLNLEFSMKNKQYIYWKGH